MGTGRSRLLTAGGALIAAAALTASLAPAGAAGTKTWHILGEAAVEQARLTETAIKNIDPSISTVEYRKGGEGNIEICGFQRTEHISVSRQARWTASGTRAGSTLILQFRNVVDGGAAFSRIKQAYAACTSDDFSQPARTTVRYSFLKKKKQVRMVWALYTTAAKTDLQRAEGLSIMRAGGALIITRTIVRDVADTTRLKMTASSALTTRQFGKYRTAAYT